PPSLTIKKKTQPKPKAKADEFSGYLNTNISVTQITSATPMTTEGAEHLFHLKLISDLGEREFCAGIAADYTCEQLVGMKIVSIQNLKPRAMFGITSSAMLLAASTHSEEGGRESIAILTPPADAEVGDRVYPEGHEEILAEDHVLPEVCPRKQWDRCVAKFGVRNEIATLGGCDLIVKGRGPVQCVGMPDNATIH
ncbi:hypothetical protein KIPB_014137, partial [Kipferlia bialata]